MREKPRTGEFYRHFKNKLYQIVSVAIHSETKEELVIYQALYGEYKVYARPLDMFMSEVDRVKYPEVTQKYRFEKVDNIGELLKEEPKNCEDKPKESVALESIHTENGVNEEESVHTEESPWADKRVMDFLEADTYAKKLDLFTLYQKNMDERLINAIAASLDTVVPEGDLESMYASIRSYLKTQVKFEVTRLR